MAEKKIKWTDQQKQAIEARGSDILVNRKDRDRGNDRRTHLFQVSPIA